MDAYDRPCYARWPTNISSVSSEVGRGAETRGCRILGSASGLPDTTSEWTKLDPSDSSCKQLFEFLRGPVRAVQRHYLEELGWKGSLLLVGLWSRNKERLHVVSGQLISSNIERAR